MGRARALFGLRGQRGQRPFLVNRPVLSSPAKRPVLSLPTSRANLSLPTNRSVPFSLLAPRGRTGGSRAFLDLGPLVLAVLDGPWCGGVGATLRVALGLGDRRARIGGAALQGGQQRRRGVALDLDAVLALRRQGQRNGEPRIETNGARGHGAGHAPRRGATRRQCTADPSAGAPPGRPGRRRRR